MIGKTNAGGGGGKLFAIIAVTYPEGSICTCVSGTKTLKAKDTSGKALFNVPAAGTWTVTARTEDGSKEKSIDVTITAAEQVESVIIQYRLYWFNGDTVNSDIGVKGAGMIYKIDSLGVKLGLSADTSSLAASGGVISENKIDITHYTKMCFNVAYTNGNLYGGMSSNTSVDPGTNIETRVKATDVGSFNVDLSSLYGSYYAALSFGDEVFAKGGVISSAWFE